MPVTRILTGCLLATLSACLGCTQPHVPADAPEGLRRLDMLTGTWRSTSQAWLDDAGQPIPCSATARVQWALDGCFVVERTDYDLGTLGRSRATGYWTWDTVAGVYRTWRFDSDGGFSTGTATYDDGTRTWYIASQTTNSRTGARSAGSGKMHFISDREKAFSWSSQPRTGADDAYRVEGVSQRVGR